MKIFFVENFWGENFLGENFFGEIFLTPLTLKEGGGVRGVTRVTTVTRVD